MDDKITCLVCNAEGVRGSIHRDGWRLAVSRIGGYVCGAVCDQVILDYDEVKKNEKKKQKAEQKGKK